MRQLTLTHDYDVSPERLWALATDYGALAQVMAGRIAFEGLPEGRTKSGQSVDVMVSLFGKLPPQPYHMDVLECNDVTWTLRSSERGAGVKSWKHRVQVTATDQGSRLTDTLEIDAGWLTRPFCIWARYLYSARHAPRVRLLQSGAF